MEYRPPKAHQLKIGAVCVQDSICGQSEQSSSDESFYLQIQVKPNQAEAKFPAPQHLVINLACKLKPHQKRIKYLRTRIDTCADVNILPVRVYQLIYDDPGCKKLAPSSKVTIRTNTTDKINIVGSCSLVVVPPDTSYLKQVTFQVTNHGSCVLSCVTTLE